MTKTTNAAQLVADLLNADPQESFALIRRQDESTIDVLRGTVAEVQQIAQIPLGSAEVLALVPFRQIRERGFPAIDDGAPLLCLKVASATAIDVADALDALDALPTDQPEIQDLGFDLSDEQYADIARHVIETEIGRGEGANFVIRRDYRAHTDAPRTRAALAWLRNLLAGESGAYWTYAFVTPQVIAVGASPERHVSAIGGKVMMNPISGTLRHGDRQPTEDELLHFLDDRKESEELVMVVDEELKMMSAVCPGGGVMRGPFLKPMSKLTHTEYLLEGTSTLDTREILRLTMFAPTVTGSPMGNACKVIARHEPSGRGYYSGVLARFTPRLGGYDLDAPILIRTAIMNDRGDITVSAGATLVRHSDPLSEAAETRAKASGMLGALGIGAARTAQTATPTTTPNPAASAPAVMEALEDRNRHLAPFWRDEQAATALVIDCEDDFTTMLGHQLRRLGVTVQIRPWHQVEDVQAPDLVVFGPGPGDPENLDDPRMAHLRALISERLDSGRPTLAVCLSHQMLSSLAGLPIRELPSPRQGMPLMVDVIDGPVRIGYYNTFSAVADNGSKTPRWGLQVRSEPDTGFVHSLLGPRVASVQGHLESVLSYDGFSVLAKLVRHVLADSSQGQVS